MNPHIIKYLMKSQNVRGNTFLQQVVEKWENEIQKFKNIGLNITIFRIGLVLSRRGGIIKTLKTPTKLNISAPIGNGNQYQSWIHEFDLRNMIIESINKKWYGVYNAVSPNPVKQKKFIKLYANSLSKYTFQFIYQKLL